MAHICILPDKTLRSIKPVHGIGQPPFISANFSLFHYLTEAGIPFSRLHDLGSYLGGRYVDIHCIFRNFEADPTDPASYDFTFTDRLITALMECGAEPFFRLGVTIENNSRIKAYNIWPPKDNMQWARICEGIIRHYTEGWADGFTYDIRYWEIWNEPDNGIYTGKLPGASENPMWAGTKEQYFALYTTAAKHLKACFPHLKIGGYASCGFYAVTKAKPTEANLYLITFMDEFLAHIKQHGAPLDFFSWHTYDRGVENIRRQARFAREKLDAAGYTETETSCNEWNCAHERQFRGTPLHASLTAAILTVFQNEPVDTAMFYDGRLGPSEYGGLFDPLKWTPLPTYYAFSAFHELEKRGTQVSLTGEETDLYACAAADDQTVAVMLCNTGAQEKSLTVTGIGAVRSCRIITEGRIWEECALPDEIPGESVLLVLADR